MSMAWPPYTNRRAVPPSTKARRPWVGGWLHSWGFTPAATASATMYQAVKVVPRMAMNEKMRMLRKDGMKVVHSPTLPNSSAYSLQTEGQVLHTAPCKQKDRCCTLPESQRISVAVTMQVHCSFTQTPSVTGRDFLCCWKQQQNSSSITGGKEQSRSLRGTITGDITCPMTVPSPSVCTMA